MTFVSILEDNPSAIVHIEKAPVSSLACFSQNAISIILDKMVLLLKQGNIFVVADLLINLDRHGLINQDIVNKVVDVVMTSKDMKPVRPALRFLSSRQPSHRHLSAIISCLAAKDQDAQIEAMEALTVVAQTAVQLSKEAFQSSIPSSTSSAASLPNLHSVSPSQLEAYLAHEKQIQQASSQQQHQHHTIPNTTAFAPLDADHSITSSGAPKLPADMVIIEGSSIKKPVEELFLMEEAHDSIVNPAPTVATTSPSSSTTTATPSTTAVTSTSSSKVATSSSSSNLPSLTKSSSIENASVVASASSSTVAMAPKTGSSTNLSSSSSATVKSPTPHGPRASSPDPSTSAMLQSTHRFSFLHGDPKTPFLYEEREWSILLRSAVSLLVDFVGLDIHRNTKNANYYNTPFDPRVRMIQCKHLASLIEMMESDEAGTRLLPFILLGNTIRSNDYDRETERQQLEAQLLILEAIGKLYTSHRRIGDVDHDLIEEMAKNNPVNRGIGYVVHDLLGLQAAKYAVMSEELIKNKPDLLCSLNSWAFARLTADARRTIFLTLSLHEKITVQQSILDLVTNNRPLIEIMDPTDLSTVVASNFGKKESPIALKRSALRFLELSALTTHSQDYRLHAIDKIIYLLGRYGFNDPVVTEPLLRILDTILSTPVVPDGSPPSPRPLRSTFQTPSPYPEDNQRPMLTQQEHKELYNLLQRSNMRQKLIQAFEMQSPQRFWTGKVLTSSLLRHFISPDSEDALEYVHFLKSNVPEIRAIALSELHRIDASLVPALLQRLKELISYEEPLVRTTYSVVIGSLGLRSEQQAMAIDVACYLMGKSDSPDVQQHGVNILSIMGESVSESVLVSAKFEEILSSKEQSLIQGEKLSEAENGLLMAMVDCITNIRLTTTTVLASMLGLLRQSPDPALRTAISLAFRRLASELVVDQKQHCLEHVLLLLHNREGYVREIGIKLIRFFGRETIKHSASRLIKMISDPELYVRKQAIKAVTCLLYKGDEQAKKEALLLLPAVSNALEDKSPLVIVQALKFLVLLKARTRSVSATLSRLAARSASIAAHTTGPDPEDDAQIAIDSEGIPVLSSISSPSPSLSSRSTIAASGSSLSISSTSGSASHSTGSTSSTTASSGGSGSASELDDDDPWYVRKVIVPNLDRVSSLLYRRRYRFNLAIKIGVLNCLGTTRFLQQHIGSFTEMLNSENVPTLVEFSDTIRRLGPGMLQYIPAIVNIIKPGSPLVRNMVRLLSRYEKQMDSRTCSRLFSLQTILSMMKNKDANVRKAAVSLMGKKVLEKSKHIWVIIQMWGDKNNKVRKEVMEVLGDIGKTNPEYISHIMNLIDTDSVTSVLVWRFLSKSWGILIGNTSDE